MIESYFDVLLTKAKKTLDVMKDGFSLGQLEILKAESRQIYSFLDYVYSGTEINLMVAIDFTNSNSDPEKQ